MTESLFASNANYRLWKYAVIVSDTSGNLYVKDGDTRQNTYDEALNYASSETTGKIRGLVQEDDILGVWDMTDDAIRRDATYDPTQTETNYRRGYDNEIRDLMPLKRRFVKNFRGQNSLELHPIPKDMLDDPNWRQLLAFMWDTKHKEIQNGGSALDLKNYSARDYLVESFNKVQSTKKFLLAAATGAGKETSTLALLVHLHDVKQYNTKTLNVAVATIPSTVSELMNELATVAGMQVPGYGFVDYARIKVYIMRQWYNSYKKDCSPQAKTMMSARATIVDSVSDIPKTHAESIVPVLFGSYHDLAQKSEDKLNARYAGLEKRIGTLSIGEAHQMLSTADNKMWKNLESAFGKKCFKLFVTGTPYDFIYGNAAAEFFTNDERALFTRNDLYRDKRTNENSDFSLYPDFNYYGIDVADIVDKLKQDPNWLDDSSGFTYPKLFAYDAVSKKFTYEKTVLWLFKRMFGSTAFDENGDPLSIYNAPELCDKAKQHIMVALPVGNKNASAEVYIGALKALLVKHGIFEGDIFDAYEDGLGDRKDDIANAQGRTLTLTCIKDCTGANIPQLGCFVFLRNIGDSVKFFEQATGRVGRRFPGKTNCGVFIGDLEASMNLMVTIEEKISFERGHDFSTREIIEDVIANYNFFSGRAGSWKKMDLPDFASILEELNARGNYGLNQCTVVTSALDGFDLLFKNKTSRESKKLELTANGNKNAKNNGNSTFEQLGLPFDKRKNPDENWHNMKLSFVAKCRFLAFIYNTETVAQCVSLVEQAIETDNTEVIDIIGKGVEYFPKIMQEGQIDVRFTNRWIQKFNDHRTNIEFVFEEFTDEIYRTDNGFVPEPNTLLRRIAEQAVTVFASNKQAKSIIDPCGGRGGFLVYLLIVAKEKNVDINPSMLYYNDIDPLAVAFFRKLNTEAALGIPDENITCLDFIKMEFGMKKFSVSVGNPPYKGQAQLHQQFFNKAVETTEDGGTVLFIQPSTIYFNKKEETQRHSQTVRDNLKKYKTSVEFVNPKIFENANVFNDLAITNLVKTPSTDRIESVTYTSGMQYTNVRLEDVTKTEMEPTMYANIVKKYKAYIKQHGCLLDVTTSDPNVKKAKITSQRGNIGGDDWYTFMPAPKKYWVNHGDFGVPAPTDAIVENIYDYFTLNFTRFGLAIYKFAGDLHGGAMGGVPLVPFTKKYNDDELYDMIGLTKKERTAINNFLPDYYDRYNKNN